jgi:hypothetical protein
MTLDEITLPADRIEVLADGTIQVREATVILRNGKRDPAIPPRYHRYVLHPGANLAGRDDRIAAVASAVWTGDVVAAWQAGAAADASAPAG